MEASDETEAHVQAKFTTKLKEYHIQDTPFSLPVSAGIIELNSLLWSLLFDENTEPNRRNKLNFEFLIQDDFLTTTLQEFINSKNLSTESVIEIEYALQEELPEFDKSVKQNDWVSFLDVLEENIIAGCYDSSIALVNGQNREVVCNLTYHERPVKCVRWINKDSFISSSQDQTVLIWNSVEESYKPSIVCKGHASSVDCLALSSLNQKFASGSYDKTIKIWNIVEQEENDEGDENVSRKKKKTNSKNKLSTRTPLVTFSSHNDAVSSLQWTSKNELISGSLDHCVKIWDIELNENKHTITGTKPILNISYSNLNQQIASGNTDNIVRIWDARITSGVVVKGTLTSHKNWVSTVNWSNSNENHLLTGSYDKKLYLWDVRKMSDVLKELGSHDDKILCSFWNDKYLLSGGADCNINFYEKN